MQQHHSRTVEYIPHPRLHGEDHSWLGPDAANIKDLWLAKMTAYYFMPCNDLSAWTDSDTGSGVSTANVNWLSLDTGITINSRAFLLSTQESWMNYATPPFRLRMSFRLGWRTVITNNVGWFGMTDPGGVNDTAIHACFKIVNGSIFATVSDGVAQNIEDTLRDVAHLGDYDMFIKYMADSVKFYINGVLTNTLVALRPTGRDLVPVCFLQTTDTVVKAVRVYPIQIALGDE